MSAEKVLVVEDERAQRDALTQYLGRAGYVVTAVATGESALERLAAEKWAVLLTDLRLPGVDGLAVVRQARERDDELGVLLMTAYASVESAIEALRIGAHDYLLKPLILEEVARKVRRLVEHRALVGENARLRRALQQPVDGHDLVAVSPAMSAVADWVRRAAATRATVLLTGETGTGKEVVARAIHQKGPDADQPFLAVNLAALPETMVESELFGHERGAFTGAERRREGLLRAAGAGTVFLDEVAELPSSAQAKLLRALESREVQPLGSDATATFEARVVAATNRDLALESQAGRFREDLYYRLNVLRIRLPPLRERPEDIPGLVSSLLARHGSRPGARIPAVSPEALRALCRHPWRGNVRELSNVLERATILADEGRIDLDQLPDDVRESAAPRLSLPEAVDRFERSHIALVLRLCDGNRERAAEELGISSATLYRRLERLGLKGRDRNGTA
ncbi:MAG: sigma-54 dependent transcriptional regulator [Vicinamibacteria bacterium]|nr:sigma-54 dependent transcriptional regulator [Vicinamibacteria bacterium]